MPPFDPLAYGPQLAPLLAIDRCRPLDAGRTMPEHRARLEGTDATTLFGDQSVVDEEMAKLCLAGLWLLYDALEESHTLSQGVKQSSGSFWHGIMHRREGDYSNAKYWFRQTGDHPVLPLLAAEATEQRLADEDWNPFGFVDSCQRAVATGAEVDTCRAIQQLEWELLFDYCARRALGT